MDEAIIKYNVELITYILLILASDLTEYNNEQLVDFTEEIEGNVDVLFKPEFLAKISNGLEVPERAVSEMAELRGLVIKLYESGWHRKLIDVGSILPIRSLALSILTDLEIEYIEPLKYANTHLEW